MGRPAGRTRCESHRPKFLAVGGSADGCRNLDQCSSCSTVVKQNSFSVAEVDFLQHILRQVQAVDVSAAQVRDFSRTVIKTFIVRFEEAVIDAIGSHIRPGIQAE